MQVFPGWDNFKVICQYIMYKGITKLVQLEILTAHSSKIDMTVSGSQSTIEQNGDQLKLKSMK